MLEQIGFASGIFSGPDQKLSIRHRELLALTYSVRKFEYWLMGTVFVACVDHHSLVFLLKEKSKQKLSLKLANAMIYLSNLTFEISHQAGNSDVVLTPDCLSRSIEFAKLETYAACDDKIIPDKIFALLSAPIIAVVQIRGMKQYLATAAGADASTTVVDSFSKCDKNYTLVFADTKYTLDEVIALQSEDNYCKDAKLKL